MFIIFLVLAWLTFASDAKAQIPLYYQLLQAYSPMSVNPSASTQSTPTSLSLSTQTTPSAENILGVSTTSPIIPNSVGGEGKVITVALLGDSMIDTLGKDLTVLQKSLAAYFPNRKFRLLNYGYGSSTIEHGLFRLTNDYEYQGSSYPSLISQKPDIIIVESFAYNNFGNTQAGFDKYWLTLGAITTSIKEKLPSAKILLAATIAPNSIIFGNGIKDIHLSPIDKIERASTIKIYLQNFTNFASSQGFPLADAYHSSLVKNEGLKEFISSDGLHPSSSGAQYFCDTISDTISKLKLIGN